MILDIIKYPNKKLKEVSKEVPLEEIKSCSSFVEDMLETMYYNNGIGLSAIQVGVDKRIVVIDVGIEPVIMFNPAIIDTTKPILLMSEGCLSLPGIRENVMRNVGVLIQYYNKNGAFCVLNSEKEYDRALDNELLSQAIQHELDHLDGKIFVDSFSSFKKDRIIKKLREQS